jgi:ferredoxin-type protein NapH
MSRNLQWLRHLLRFAVLASLFLIPLMAHYRIAVEQHQIERLRSVGASNSAESILLVMDTIVASGPKTEPGGPSDRELRAQASLQINRVRGNIWSFSIFGLSWTDLLAGVESMFTSRAIIWAALWGMLLPVGLTLLFGRVFCSWICPAGLLFAMGDAVRKRLPWPVNIQKHHPVWRGHKYVLLGVGLMMSAILGMPLLGMLYPPALLGRESHAMLDGLFGAAGVVSLTGISLFLLIALMVELLVAPRVWCRSFCPGGAIYGLLGMRRVVRVENNLHECSNCAACLKSCPMGLNPMKDANGIECDNCLACLCSCETGSLQLHAGLRKVPALKFQNGGQK